MFEQPDFDFARRSIRYLLANHCSPSEILDALTTGLALDADVAHGLLTETADLAAA